MPFTLQTAHFAIFAIFLTTPIAAQQPVITPDIPTTPVTLQQWLHSGDPRLIAWAADFARRTHDTTILNELPALLERRPAPPRHDFGTPYRDELTAVTVILDALIQEDVHVSIETIRSIVSTFPAYAIILISRLPFSESQSTLDSWARNYSGNLLGPIVARIASMMLAKHPTPDFVSSPTGSVCLMATCRGRCARKPPSSGPPKPPTSRNSAPPSKLIARPCFRPSSLCINSASSPPARPQTHPVSSSRSAARSLVAHSQSSLKNNS